MHREDEPVGFAAATVRDARCDTCNNATTKAAGIVNLTDGATICICQWCLSTLLSELTGFGFTNQLLSWETLSNSRKVTQWRGWQRVDVRRDAGDASSPPQD